MVYDESRTRNFIIEPRCPGFDGMSSEIQRERAWERRKTFMKAPFDEAGDCAVYPTTAGVKMKYSWYFFGIRSVNYLI